MDSISIITEHQVEGVSAPLLSNPNILSMSEYLKNSVVEGVINIPIEASIRPHIMKIIIDYCEYNQSRPDLSDNTDWFKNEFSKEWDIATTFRVARASEFLGVACLLSNTMKKLEEILQNTKLEDIKTLLSFKEDTSKEDRLP